MSLHTSITALEAFKLVFDFCNDQSRSIYGGSNAHKYLMDMYDLTIGGVEAIAYLLHFYPSEISGSKLRVFPNNRNESSVTVFEELKNRGFIEERHTAGMFGSCFAVTKEAYEAFSGNKAFGPSLFADCYEELKSCTMTDIFSKRWLDRFTSSFELPANKQFKDAFQVLELTSQTEMVQKVFWAVAKYFVHHFTDVFYLNEESVGCDDIDEHLGVLAKAGLVILLPSDDEGKSHSEYVLSPKAAGLLFHGHDEVLKYDEIAKYSNLIKCRDIEKKELFFSNDAQEEINHLRTMISKNGFIRVQDVQSRKKRARSVVSLLWGPPGTGKTETVKQLAQESGRDVVKFDMAKVTGSNWGATEKYYRALFRAYNYIAVLSDNVPILLLNEADDILSKRLTSIDRAIDKSENTVANILLEEIENLNGILLATSNLIDNIDTAFERRFLFKTRLIKPDATARAKIWKSSIPELTEDEARRLGNTFEMSGAQIDNVVVKRDLAELYFEGDRGYDYIVRLCEKELSTEDGSKAFRPHIGY